MSEQLLVLRTCSADGTSRNGFRWPKRGKVVAPDWDPKPVCGRGLHGLPGGEGDGDLLNWDPSARWQVVRVDGDWVDLDRKIKFESGYVLHTGTQASATSYLAARAPGRAIVGLIATCGNYSHLFGGDRSTLTGGDYSTLVGGEWSALTAGDNSVLCWQVWDGYRCRMHVAYVGEGGIKPDVAYRWSDGGPEEAR
jgi:hypothetical protein